MATSQPLVAFLEQSDEFLNACAAIYTTLDPQKSQIRLVHIQPASDENEDIHLTLEVVSLDDLPAFQAISYTWGSRLPVAQVYLHEHLYNVTQNQHAALRRFRQVDRVRTMWMDVICINEDDVAERGSQVGMMSRIYSTSQQTQIWLGEADAACTKKLTDEEWSTMQTWFWERRSKPKWEALLAIIYENQAFSHQAERASAFKDAVEKPDGVICGAIHILGLLGSDIHYWELPASFLDAGGEVHISRPWFESMQALKAILRKPYWGRVWTVQEAILSPSDATVHIGKYEIPFSHFLNLGKATVEHGGTSVACCGEMSTMIMYEDDALDSDQFLTVTDRSNTLYAFSRHLETGKLDFAEAVQLSNGMEAFDARDYVYGVLGFVNYDLSSLTDYSLSTSEVFQKATVLCWGARGSLGFLKKGSLDCEGRMPHLPSWCIDFTNSESLSFQFYESFFEGEGVDWDTIDVDLEHQRIVLSGIPSGTIKLRFERPNPPTSKPTVQNVKIVTEWTSRLEAEHLEQNIELDPQTNRLFFRRFFDTIFRDTVFGMKDGDADLRRLDESDWEDIEYWWGIASQGSAASQWESERQNEVWSRIRKVSLAFYLGLADSTLAVTSDNQLALVPLTAKPGDYLFHVTGCCMPLVLREVESSSDDIDVGLAAITLDTVTNESVKPVVRTFRLVGPCYVKELMGSNRFQGLQTERIALI